MAIGRNRGSFLLAGALLACGLTGAAGCASVPEGQQRAEETSIGLRELRDEMIGVKESTVAVAVALDDLINGSAATRERYEGFQDQHDRLRERAERMRDRESSMNRRANEYLDGWEPEIRGIQDEELRETAEMRRARVKRTLGDVRAKLAAARDAFEPYDRDLEDIRRYLSNDLTSSGLAVARPKIEQAVEDVRGIQAPLDEAIARLDDLSKALAPPGS